MPTLRTKYVPLGAGVFICRRGDAVHIVTTGDNQAPDMGKIDMADGTGGSSEAMSKANWITEQEVSVEQFGDMVGTVAPEYSGQLVNVGTDEKPLLLTQQQATIHADLVADQVAALQADAATTVLPVKP